MQNFNIIANVPIEGPTMAERVGSTILATLERNTARMAVKVGQGAILAYAGMYDSIRETDTRPELIELLNS